MILSLPFFLLYYSSPLSLSLTHIHTYTHYMALSDIHGVRMGAESPTQLDVLVRVPFSVLYSGVVSLKVIILPRAQLSVWFSFVLLLQTDWFFLLFFSFFVIFYLFIILTQLISENILTAIQIVNIIIIVKILRNGHILSPC